MSEGLEILPMVLLVYYARLALICLLLLAYLDVLTANHRSLLTYPDPPIIIAGVGQLRLPAA